MSLASTSWMAAGDQWWRIDTPFGEMLLAGNATELHQVLLPNSAQEVAALGVLSDDSKGCPQAVARTAEQLGEYFCGERQFFELELAPAGTQFQRSVWFALSSIPYGQTATYGDIAAVVGRPTAYRAVGASNARNPLPVVLPCHRVIGSDGRLVGFGGGLSLKQALLDHERCVLAR
jgi:methylated-DNA-[protein]-cysteine S-methyltransferase